MFAEYHLYSADGIQFIHSQEVDIPKIKQWLSAVMLWAKIPIKEIKVP